MEQAAAVTREFEAQYPQCGNVLVGRAVAPEAAPEAAPEGGQGVLVPILSADCRRRPGAADIKRIHDWLKVRTGDAGAKLVLWATRGKIIRREALAAGPAPASKG